MNAVDDVNAVRQEPCKDQEIVAVRTSKFRRYLPGGSSWKTVLPSAYCQAVQIF